VRVLLTGGAGFIGTAARRALGAAGHEVVIYDSARDVRDDICRLDRLRVAISGCDVVAHLAAKVGLGVDISDIDDYAYRNDYGTAVVLRAAAEARIARIVYASSMVVYGEGPYRCARHGPVRPAARNCIELEAGRFEPPCPRCGKPLTPALVVETATLDPRNVYATTKVHGEHLCAAWSRETAAPVAALRFHNVYGPGMPRDTSYAGVAALFASQLAAGQAPTVFEDGRQRRNFVHVDDVAAAVTASVTADLGPGVTALNVGSTEITTVARMAAVMSSAVGGAEPVITGRYRLGDVRHITADVTAAERVLGWRARIGLQQGVSALVSRTARSALPGGQ
jgi:dTDP-L-rhamnose 4-epimerase